MAKNRSRGSNPRPESNRPGAVVKRAYRRPHLIESITYPEVLALPSFGGAGTHQYPIIPAFMTGTSLSHRCVSFEKFLLREITYEFKSSMASTASGTYMMAFNHDSTDEYSDMSSLRGLNEKTVERVSESSSLRIGFDSDVQPMHCDSDNVITDRAEIPGILYLSTDSALSGTLTVKYRVEYFHPKFDTTPFTDLGTGFTIVNGNVEVVVEPGVAAEVTAGQWTPRFYKDSTLWTSTPGRRILMRTSGVTGTARNAITGTVIGIGTILVATIASYYTNSSGIRVLTTAASALLSSLRTLGGDPVKLGANSQLGLSQIFGQ